LYLKSITLRGFKSFANRSKLIFEPGISVIVGPNGSGKSNIADAVSWVLGEQSPKSLRGGTMGDVIFRSKKEELGIAEVSLVFNNSDGSMPLEFREVKFTRRVYSKGSSDYFINSSPCRLIDIQEIILDSGIGKGLYIIINQGQINEVAVLKSIERKNIIDELLGISKHRIRKDKSKIKLLKVNEDINRIDDLLQEVKRTMDPLQIEAKKAQKYYELLNALKKEEISLFLTYINDLNYKWGIENKAYDKYKYELDEIIKKLSNAIKRKEDYGKMISNRRKEFNYWESLIKNFTSKEGELKNISTLVSSLSSMFSTIYNMFDLKLHRNSNRKDPVEKEEGNYSVINSSTVQVFLKKLEKIENLFFRILEKIKTIAVSRDIMLKIEDEGNAVKGELNSLKEVIGKYRLKNESRDESKNSPNKLVENKVKSLCKKSLNRSEQLMRVIKGILVVSKKIKGRSYPEFEKKRTAVKEELDKLEELGSDIGKLNVSKSDLENNLYKINLKKEQIKERVKDITSKIVDDYSLSLDYVFKNYKPVVDVKKSSTIINKLKNDIKKCGSVNPNADLEYKKIKERFDFLSWQKQDLIESKNSLEELINKINSEIENYFMERFDEINKNFKYYFKTLFPLGEGEMQLIKNDGKENDNIGVDLKVDIGNNKFVPLSLLSGGEKSLVSIAFLFSIFSTKPSPFYIFDEVDASLDDINLSRFLSLVKKFSEKKQLILITHQKRTMEIADTIYGVTMQSDSVSKIVSEKIGDRYAEVN